VLRLEGPEKDQIITTRFTWCARKSHTKEKQTPQCRKNICKGLQQAKISD
jgi:hypothetical protein